jgi:hypothetical protein
VCVGALIGQIPVRTPEHDVDTQYSFTESTVDLSIQNLHLFRTYIMENSLGYLSLRRMKRFFFTGVVTLLPIQFCTTEGNWIHWNNIFRAP